MKEFMLLFRHEPTEGYEPSTEELQESIQKWQNWIGNIAAQMKFVSTNQLGFEGKTVKPNNIVTDGPYTETKEIIGGYIIVKADTIDEAVSLTQGCPILEFGGNVEVRNILIINPL